LLAAIRTVAGEVTNELQSCVLTAVAVGESSVKLLSEAQMLRRMLADCTIAGEVTDVALTRCVLAGWCTIAGEVANVAQMLRRMLAECTIAGEVTDVALATEALAGSLALGAGTVVGEWEGTVGCDDACWRFARRRACRPCRADRAREDKRALLLPLLPCVPPRFSVAMESFSDIGLTGCRFGLTVPWSSIDEKVARAALEQRVDSVHLSRWSSLSLAAMLRAA
jgi:hypothetical protein